MVGSFLAPKWPIMVPFCGMDHQKSNFSLISDTLSVGGCWGQPMLLFWKLVDETQMVKPPEPTSHHNSRKYLILLPLRAIYFRSLHYETPCSSNYDNDNTQQDQNRKLVLGIWSPSDKGHMVFSSQKYGGKTISLIHYINTIYGISFLASKGRF